MATRSMIGKLNDNGTVTAIYCHWDGYLEHNGKLLVENYTDSNKIDKLMELGDLSSLGDEIGEGKCVAYGRDRGEKNTKATVYNLADYSTSGAGISRGVDYMYLFDGKQWLYQTYSQTEWQPVTIKKELA